MNNLSNILSHGRKSLPLFLIVTLSWVPEEVLKLPKLFVQGIVDVQAVRNGKRKEKKNMCTRSQIRNIYSLPFSLTFSDPLQ